MIEQYPNGISTVIKTPVCNWCQKPGQVEVPYSREETEFRITAWKSGAYIQDAFREISAGLREQIKTGYHPECWDEMVAGLDDDEEF